MCCSSFRKSKNAIFEQEFNSSDVSYFTFFYHLFLLVLFLDFLFGTLKDIPASVASEDIPLYYLFIFLAKVSRQTQRYKALPPAASNVSE